MNGPLPALVYVDVACELYPDIAPQIRAGVEEFYSDPSTRCGEFLVQKGIITDEQNRLILLAQKTQRGMLDAADRDELQQIQSEVHLRTMAHIEELGMLFRKMKDHEE